MNLVISEVFKPSICATNKVNSFLSLTNNEKGEILIELELYNNYEYFVHKLKEKEKNKKKLKK